MRCRTGELYTGCTTNLRRRVEDHNEGRGAKFTRSRTPVALVYEEPAANRSKALKREIAIKAMSRAEKLRLVAQAASATTA